MTPQKDNQEICENCGKIKEEHYKERRWGNEESFYCYSIKEGIELHLNMVQKFTPRNNQPQKRNGSKTADTDGSNKNCMSSSGTSTNEEIEKEFENNIYLPKLRESLNELKKELLGKTLDEEDVKLISDSYEALIKEIIKQVIPIVQKALSLSTHNVRGEQENKELKHQLENQKGIAERNEEALDEQRKEWIELSKKEMSSLQEKIEKWFKNNFTLDEKQFKEYILCNNKKEMGQ
ncbi:MAG: hypothetical protein M0R17_05930 [Candidatus Omnitrophica bacterium]|jgi:hypothetical protein|nr:hypothetical protein [Candidatus Omnitrophota bacterium]